MFRDITINKVSFYLTFLITTISCFLFFVGKSDLSNFSTLWILISFIILTCGIFLLIRQLLKVTVFNRINLIYRIIRDGGAVNESGFNENTKIDQLNNEVEKWALNTKEEIRNLKELRDYRKGFVGNVSHELKTPIFSIQGYLHTLLEGGLHDESINQKYLQKALSNLDRLQFIVEDLDTINHLESNSEAIIMSKFDFNKLVIDVYGELESVAENAKIKLTFNAGDGSPQMVKADKNRIHQVLYNLVINSIKYGNEYGTTTVVVTPLKGHYVIEVIDDGIGIEQKHLKHLFDRFYRVDESRSRDSGGSGLGLSIVKHVLESHNQSIGVNSIPGKGTTFNFTLARA